MAHNSGKVNLLDYWLIIKDTAQEQPEGTDSQGKVLAGTQDFHALPSALLSQALYATQELPEPRSWGYLTHDD